MERIKIPFKGWDLVAWINEKDGDHMIAVKPIAEAIGVDWKSQHRKIEKDPRFSCGHMTTTGTDEKNYKMLCLPVKQLNGWLYGINANKVKPEVRQKLLNFQEECHMHLHNALSGKANAGVVDLLYKKVDVLEKLVFELAASNRMLTASNRAQQSQIERLESKQAIYDDSEQMLASVGGKILAHSRKTKQLRH